MARFEIVKTTLNEISIRDNERGEILHNPAGPWKESRGLYVKPTKLEERLLTATNDPLVLFDVGLGAAFNALAAYKCHRDLAGRAPQLRPLHVISFENDFKLFDFAVENIGAFPQSAVFTEELLELQKSRNVRRARFQWEVVDGNFPDTMNEPNAVPEIVFFDPFSPAANQEMWSLETLTGLYRLARRCPHPSCFSTYSMATGIRAGLLLAGYFVGAGPQSGPKAETTFAATVPSDVERPLDARWMGRWRRSKQPLPPQTELAIEEAERRLMEHPQFRGQH